MQIFTTEMLIQMYVQSREVARELFGAILGAAWHNVTGSFVQFFAAIVGGDWESMFMAAFLLFTGSLVFYRLVRRNLWTTIQSILKD